MTHETTGEPWVPEAPEPAGPATYDECPDCLAELTSHALCRRCGRLLVQTGSRVMHESGRHHGEVTLVTLTDYGTLVSVKWDAGLTERLYAEELRRDEP